MSLHTHEEASTPKVRKKLRSAPSGTVHRLSEHVEPERTMRVAVRIRFFAWHRSFGVLGREPEGILVCERPDLIHDVTEGAFVRHGITAYTRLGTDARVAARRGRGAACVARGGNHGRMGDSPASLRTVSATAHKKQNPTY